MQTNPYSEKINVLSKELLDITLERLRLKSRQKELQRQIDDELNADIESALAKIEQDTTAKY
jgi:ABC-type phosphate transport system auxiliary subunit